MFTLAIPFHRSSPCRFLLNRRIFRGVMVSKSRSLSTSRMTELSLEKSERASIGMSDQRRSALFVVLEVFIPKMRSKFE